MLDDFIHKIVRSPAVRIGLIVALAVGHLIFRMSERSTLAHSVGSFLVLGAAIALTIIHIGVFFLGLEGWWKKRGKRSSPP